MRQFISSVFKKSALVTVAAVSVMSLAWASVVTVTQPGTAAATISCTPNLGTDQDTNIIFNGLAGTTADAMRTSLQTAFTNNDSGNHCNDIQALLGGLGLTNTMLANSTGWTTGWTKHDGTVSTDAGTVVGTGAQIYSRCWIENTSTGQSNCNPLSMYQLVLNEKNGNYLGVYQHAATFFTNRSQTPERTLIHINSDGQADFAIWKDCGNAVKFTPVVPPKQVAVCVQLDALKSDENETSVTYNFTVTATVENVKNIDYTISFGDGSSDAKSVTNGEASATFNHTYDRLETDKTYTAKAQVNHATQVAACTKPVQVPAKKKEVKALVCTNLSAKALDGAKTKYTFTATASMTNTTADHFTFTFDNGTTEDVTANSTGTTTAMAQSSTQTFAPGDHTITATVTGPLGTFGSTACSTKITVPAPTPLPNTGPEGLFGLFGLTTVAGGLFHQFVLRRKLSV